MKTRTRHFASRSMAALGAAGWTSADLEAARRQANELARPRGHLNPTPGEAWTARTPTPSEKILAELAEEIDPAKPSHLHRVLRSAVAQALLDRGLLTITWRSITLPVNRPIPARIT